MPCEELLTIRTQVSVPDLFARIAVGFVWASDFMNLRTRASGYALHSSDSFLIPAWASRSAISARMLSSLFYTVCTFLAGVTVFGLRSTNLRSSLFGYVSLIWMLSSYGWVLTLRPTNSLLWRLFGNTSTCASAFPGTNYILQYNPPLTM